MAITNWQRWYRDGTVSIIKDSKTVTGTKTYWLSASIKAGDVFSVDGVTDYEVGAVTDDTHITLVTPWAGSNVTNVEYHIHRAFSASTGADVAAQTAALVSDMARYIDNEQATIKGKSAYEIAKENGFLGTESAWLNSLVGKTAYEVARDNGYTGTQAQWLESLKAAGELTVLKDRTGFLDDVLLTGYGHNGIYRGKNLGTGPTSEQLAAIKAGTFDDMYIGDYWEKDGVQYRIGAFNYHPRGDMPALNVTTGTQEPLGIRAESVDVRLDPYVSCRPHVIVVADTGILSEATPYYSDDDYDEETGMWAPYWNCYWYREIRPQVLEKVKGVFGEEHMLTWGEYLDNGFNGTNGKATGFTYTLMQCELMTTQMVHGRRLVQGANVNTNYSSVGNSFRGRLPLYRFDTGYHYRPKGSDPYGIYAGYHWLRDVFGLSGGKPAADYWATDWGPRTTVGEKCSTAVFFTLGQR